MDLKLNVQKRGLSTTEAIINEEFTLHYGHIFRGEDAETLIIDYETAKTLYNSGGQSEEFKSIYSKLVSNPSMNVAIRFWGESYIASSHIATDNAKFYIRVDCQYISKGVKLGGGEIWQLRTASVNITPEGGVSLLQSYTKELVDSSLVSDDLTTFDETRVLSARQGAVLKDTKVGYVEKDEDTGDFVLYATNNVSRASNVEIGRIKVGCATPVTYAELCGLKLAGRLTAGAFYRITDYVTKVKPNHNGFNNTRSAEHPFDIIVQALDKSTLSENAQAILHDGDTYFAGSNLKAWQLKYSLDADAKRFAWGVDAAREQSWSCAWGILESKPNSDASSNYERVVVDGKTKYLYRPIEPTSHLQGKQFYRDVVISSIESPDGFIYEADSAPSYSYDEEMGEEYYDYPSEIRVKTADGKQVATFVQEYDSYYYDENNSEYYITFGSSYEEVNGVYHLTPESGIEDWWEYGIGGSIDETEREYYNGAVDSLYYAFDAIIPKSNKSVTEVTDKVHIYKSVGIIDTITYRSYIAPEDGGRGVIYGMTDEFNNFLPFDFKNIQFKDGDDWFYVFGATDTSLSGGAKCNYINCVSDNKSLFRIIFKGTTEFNHFEFKFSDDDGLGVVFNGDCKANMIRTNSSGFKSIYVTEGFYSNNLSNNTQGAFELIGRMTGVRIAYANNLSVKGNFFGGSFYGNGTFQLVDSRGNNKAARNMKVNFGYSKSNLKLVFDGTTSSNASYLLDTEIHASDWGEDEQTINIDTYLNKNKRYQYLKIAKNSAGNIKVWCEADLVD